MYIKYLPDPYKSYYIEYILIKIQKDKCQHGVLHYRFGDASPSPFFFGSLLYVLSVFYYLSYPLRKSGLIVLPSRIHFPALN